MKILYCAPRWDYGVKERGECHEQVTLFHTMINMGFDIVQFDFLELAREIGKEETNKKLLAIVDEHKPDLLFAVLYEDEILPQTIERITRNTSTITFNWFTDDHWRFDKFSRHVAPAFSFVSTTDPDAMPKYHSIGYKNVILTQWACNHFLYKPSGEKKMFDTTFIGQPHGDRRQVIFYLRKKGINVKTWGFGWEAGRLGQQEMISAFSTSKINLNLSNASAGAWFKFWGKNTQQIKGRNFEVPGCGGFLLTNYVPYIEKYFVIGKEIVCFGGKRDLAKKICYYLEHEDEREAIAKAGYDRTIKDHTYEIRLREILKIIGILV